MFSIKFLHSVNLISQKIFPSQLYASWKMINLLMLRNTAVKSCFKLRTSPVNTPLVLLLRFVFKHTVILKCKSYETKINLTVKSKVKTFIGLYLRSCLKASPVPVIRFKNKKILTRVNCMRYCSFRNIKCFHCLF